MISISNQTKENHTKNLIFLAHELLLAFPVIPLLFFVLESITELDSHTLILIPYLCSAYFIIFKRLPLKWKLISGCAILAGIFIEKPSINFFFLIGLSLLAVLLGYISFHNKVLQLVIAIGCLALVFSCMLLGYDISSFLVANSFIPILLWLATFSRKITHGTGTNSKDNIPYTVYVSPFILIVFLMVAICPKSDKPYDWAPFVKIYNTVEQKVSSIINSENWGESSSLTPIVGFSEKSSFAGNLNDNPKDMLLVSTIQKTSGPLYLTGKVFDTFTGTSWEANYTGTTKDMTLDTIETLCAVKGCSDRNFNFSSYMNKSYLDLTYQYMNTPFVFAPIKSLPEKNDVVSLGIHHEKGSLTFKKKHKYGTEYTITYYVMNSDSEIIANLLNNNTTITKELWESVLFEENLSYDKQLSYDSYLQYKKHIEEDYCATPTLSPEMKAYMAEIIGDANSDYEKLQRIQAELSSLTYTTSPGKYPDELTSEADFLDYFLLEKKEGYCTYFATAFVLLARYEGIPAKYIQGYMIPTTSSNFCVISSNAHAWPEAYLQGIGWVTFEPTPGYNAGTSWSSNQTSQEKPVRTGTFYRTPSSSDTNQISPSPEDDSTATNSTFSIKGFLEILAVTILLTVCLLWLDFIIKKYRFTKLDNRKKAVAICHKAMKLFDLCGYRPSQGETLQEFYYRLQSKEGFIDKELQLILDLQSLSYDDCYSPDLTKINQSYELVRQGIKHHLSAPRYLIIKLVY